MAPYKILPVERIKQLDARTLLNESITSFDLMERAANQCFEWINLIAGSIDSFKVVCGMGNNGGDGLVIARKLHKSGKNVEVFYIRHSQNATEDNIRNFKKIADTAGLIVTEVFEEDPSIEINKGDVVIDAIIGSGLSQPVTGFIAEIIKQINESESYVISIDIPSGLFADKPIVSTSKSAIVKADYTLTFQLPKLAFFIPENDIYVGNWQILDINLDKSFIEKSTTDYFLIQKKDCQEIYRPRPRYSHKGTYGHGLLIAGSLGKIGASILASKAALRAGAGLITTHIPLCGMDAMHSNIPEIMIDLDQSETHNTVLPDLSGYNAIAIGPGLGMHDETKNMLKYLIQESKNPLIIDADALNILGENRTWLAFLPPDSILTPHPKEFERLTSKTDNHFSRLEILKAFSQRYKVYVILKGAYSAIGCPDGSVYFNPTGNPGMATGGTGDVLTGILLGLKASGYSSKNTCILGTWLHGKAADIAVKSITQPSLIASDIIKDLGKAFKKII
ncbi:MAG: NAD(P)H-hydrate dehydratase [Omnitrophica WOR_2 bacterium]